MLTSLRLKTYLILLLAGCAIGNVLTAQSYKSVDVDLSEELIDLISFNNKHIHLVTSRGIYDFNDLIPSPLKLVDAGDPVQRPLQTFTRLDNHCYYPLKMGDFIFSDRNQNLRIVESGDLDNGLILVTRSGKKWLVNTSMYEHLHGKWQFTKSVGPKAGSIKDGKTYQDELWLIYEKGGVVKVDENKELRNYTKLDGLYDDNPSTISIAGDGSIFVGHRSGLSIITPNGVQSVELDLKSPLSTISEIEHDNNGKTWIITKKGLYTYQEGKTSEVKVDLKPKENFVSLQIAKDQNVYVLTSDRVLILPNTNLKHYTIDNKNPKESVVSFYQIRGNQYYSDTKSVYKLDQEEGIWKVDKKKKAPHSIVHDNRSNPILVSKNNRGTCIDRNHAGVKYKVSVPEGEKLQNLIRIYKKKYYATATNLYENNYGGFKLISHKEDSYYNVLHTINGDYAFAQHGIYRLDEDQMTPLLASYNNSSFPYSTNQFVLIDKLVTFKENSIQLVNTRNESIQELGMHPLKILDIQQTETSVWLLCEKSLIALDKSQLYQGKIRTLKVIPTYLILDEGQLHMPSEKELWAVGKKSILKININDPVTIYKPSMMLLKAEDKDGNLLEGEGAHDYAIKIAQMPVSLTYVASNHWTDNITYTFHTNNEGRNLSEWKSENIYELDENKSGHYIITAKFKDDIFGMNIYAEPVTINVAEQIVISGQKGNNHRIPFILISLLSLCILYIIFRSKIVFK